MQLLRSPLQQTLLLAATVTSALMPTLASAQVPAGRTVLDMSANAYHDNQYFSQFNVTGQSISANLHALDITGDPVADLYGSKHEAQTSGSVDPTSISLYSRSYAYAKSSSGPYSSFASSSAVAQVTTPFKISSAGTPVAPGSPGTLVAQLHVSGDVQVDPALFGGPGSKYAEGRAHMYFWATGLNASGCTYYVDAGCLDITRDSQGTVINSNNALRTWTLNIPFSFDNWTSMTLQMFTGARSFVVANGDGGWLQHHSVSDFGHTLRWGGITSVLDANGQALSGWGIESYAGLDLRVAAVPEPGTWALMLCGVFAIGAMRLRTRRTQA